MTDEAADWAAWLDLFERTIWPVFERRGYSKDTAALVYFRMLPTVVVDATDGTDDDDDEKED